MALESFLQGFAQQQLSPTGYLGGKLEDEQIRRKNKLELALASKKLEQEMAAKAFQPNVSQFIAERAGFGGMQPQQRLQPEEASQLGSMFRAQTSANARMSGGRGRRVLRNVGNSVVLFDLDSGEVVKDVGLNPASEQKVRTAVADFNVSDNLLNTIKAVSTKQLLSQEDSNTLSRAINGLSLKLANYMGNDPNAAMFIRGIDAFSSQLSKASGQKGVLTERDVQMIIKTLPSPFDSAETADALIEQLRQLYEDIKEGSINAWTAPLPEITGKTKPGGSGKKSPPKLSKEEQAAMDLLD